MLVFNCPVPIVYYNFSFENIYETAGYPVIGASLSVPHTGESAVARDLVRMHGPPGNDCYMMNGYYLGTIATCCSRQKHVRMWLAT